MKSKLFLSLSLLTAVFSQANSVGHVDETNKYRPCHLDQTTIYLNKVKANAIKSADLLTQLNFESQIKAAASKALALGKGFSPAIALGTGLVGYAAYENYSTKQAELPNTELPNKTYVQIAKDGIVSAYNTVTTSSVNGFNTAKTFAMENKAMTAGAVAGTAAVVYGAYKLYNSDMFAKSSNKKQTTSVAKTPVVIPTPKGNRVRR